MYVEFMLATHFWAIQYRQGHFSSRKYPIGKYMQHIAICPNKQQIQSAN